MKIGFIGCGTIVDALVRSIAAHDHSIFVSERGAAISKALADSFDNVARAVNQDVISNSDVIVIGLVDSVATETLSELKFSPDQRVISVMANVSLEEVQRLVAPAKADAVMIPFPGIANGGSPILVQGTNDLIRHLWGAENSVFDLATKTELDSYLCAQAVLSPVSRMVAETADWLAPKLQDPSQGEAFLRSLIASSLVGTPAVTLIDALNTAGGYNQRLRQHMERNGLQTDLRAGLNDMEAST